MSVVIDQPECRLLEGFEGRSCNEITELETFKDIEYIIIKESNHRLGEGRRYTVTNKTDNKDCYQIKQETPCHFSLHEINDKFRIVHIHLPVHTSCLCPCGGSCRLKSRVLLHPNTQLGLVEQTLSWGQPCFNVYDMWGECILKIDGSFAMMFFTIGRHKITNLQGCIVGDIYVRYSSSSSGNLHDIFLKFTKTLDVSTKLTLLGAGLMFANAQASRV